MPKTKQGKWSLGLSMAFLVILLIEIYSDIVFVPTILLMVVGIIAFLLGMKVVFKNNDRYLLGVLNVLPGVCVVWIIILESLNMH